MSFLNPWVAVGLAAAVVPTLLLLYFLKLRRREQRVSSTLLWKRAVQDLQVNAPFQRLRRNLLLILQLVILLAALAAIARPIIRSSLVDEDRVVLLLDRSASMNTLEGGQSRLDQAKDQAVRLVKTLNRGKQGWRSLFSWAGSEARTQVMVIAFADRATIVSPFTTNVSDLEDLIRGIAPTDGRSDLREALELARAYMAPPTMLTPGMEGTPVSAETPARLLLISDGRLPNLDKLVVKGGTLEWLRVGSANDNVGITALRTQRNYERPEQLEVFARVANFGPQPVQTDVSIYLDGTLATTQTVALAAKPVMSAGTPADPSRARKEAAQSEREAPASAASPAGLDAAPASTDNPNAVSLSWDLPLDRGAILEARLSRPDALSVDNSAFTVVPPPRRLRVAVVGEPNRLLESVLAGLPLAERVSVAPADWEANADNRFESDGQCPFDVVLFDKYTPTRLPRGNYLFIGAVPKLEGVQAGEPIRNAPLIWWDETSPILRYVALEYVYIGEALTITVPKAAQVLVEGTQGPALCRYTEGGRNCLILAFAIENSTWWSKQGFPIFAYNAIRYLGGTAAGDEAPTRPGDSFRVPLPAGETAAVLVRPDGGQVRLTADASGAAYFGGTERAGVYRIDRGGLPGQDRFAVNLEDDWESDVGPSSAPLTVEGGQPIKEVSAIRTSTPEVWRWCIGAALVLVVLEWWVYNRRVMV